MISYKPTTVYVYKSTSLNIAIHNSIDTTAKHYCPPIWYNSYLATLFPFGTSLNLAYNRQNLRNDSDNFDSGYSVDWFPHSPQQHLETSDDKHHRIILYFPGLGVTSNDVVSQVFAKTVVDAGYICGIINPRGHCHFGKSNTLWHPGYSGDAMHILSEIYSTYRDEGVDVEVLVAGFSGSTVLLSNALAEISETKPEWFHGIGTRFRIVGALCCCFNCNYALAKQKLESNWVGRILSWMLCTRYQSMFVLPNSNMFTKPTFARLMSARSLSTYEQIMYGIYGYKTMDELDAAYDIIQSIGKICIPTVLLQPTDDPFHIHSFGNVRGGIPVNTLTENPYVIWVEPSHGAHFGFVNDGPTSYTYPAKVAIALFTATTQHAMRI